jgi:hypothetical protein
MSKIFYQCSVCGGTEILKYAISVWNESRQQWDEDGSAELMCGNCGSAEVLRNNVGDPEQLMAKPIVQIGIHLYSVYLSKEYLKNKFELEHEGLTLNFNKSTMGYVKGYGLDGLEVGDLDKLVLHCTDMLNNHKPNRRDAEQ